MGTGESRHGLESAILSRERLAGYVPDVLSQATVIAAGAGALGQSVALNLALSQVGDLAFVDFDELKPSNSTRSPLFPHPFERTSWGSFKAKVLAHKLRKVVASGNLTRLRYFSGPVQALGDRAFHEATVVISAVDNAAARAWLSDMCRRYTIPLVEGGFDGFDISCAAYRNQPNDPCWSCAGDPVDRAIRFSCDAYASSMERQGFIPATQTAAATLGGLVAEAAIQLAHGNCELANKRLYLNIRTGKSAVVPLPFDADCTGRHQPLPKDLIPLNATCDVSLAELFDEITRHIREPILHLPDGFIHVMPCRECHRPVLIRRPLWSVREQPQCADCGGQWARAKTYPALPLLIDYMITVRNEELFGFRCRDIGIGDGAALEVGSGSGESRWVMLSAAEADVFSCVPFNKGGSDDC